MSDKDPLVGHQVGRYQIQSFLREDRLGSVYLAHELPSKRPVDVKVLDPAYAANDELFARFGREMLATATINHPNSVAMLDFGDHRGLFHYIVLEHLDARTVEDEIQRLGKLPPPRVAAIGHQVAQALDAAHKDKIIHRNLCPANVLLLDNADGDFVKIRDFGLARLLDPEDPNAGTLTAAGARVGSPAYMPPEYITAGIIHRRGDLYALGVCMYEMLTGETPYSGTAAEQMDKQVSGEVPRPSAKAKVPPWLDDLVVALMSKDMTQRPSTGAEIAQLLEVGLGQPIELPAISDAPKVTAAPSHLPVTALALGIGFIVLVLVLVALLLSLGLLFI